MNVGGFWVMEHGAWGWSGNKRRCLVLALICAGMLRAGAAYADEPDSATRTAARALGTSGVDAFQEGRYEQASDELDKAYQILHVPTLGLWSARAFAKRALLVEAAARYLETTKLAVPTRDGAIQKKAVDDAKVELDALRPNIPRLKIELIGASPAEVQLTLDGRGIDTTELDAPQLVNPGKHALVGVRGDTRVESSETVSEGQQRQIRLQFPTTTAEPDARAQTRPEPAPAPHFRDPTRDQPPVSHQRTWAVVALAAGGVGLAVGGVSGVLAINKRAELDDTGQCHGGCPASLSDSVDKLMAYRTISTVGFVAGGVLAGAGIALWLTAPSSSGRQTSARLGPGSVSVEGTF